jgi:predicted nucleotidyltransferase
VKPAAETARRIEQAAAALAQALGERVVCIAVYGSAAGDDFSPAHSDVNLLLVLREVSFADLRLIGTMLAREAGTVPFATPLVVTPSFLRDAADSFPIELDDLRERHRVLHGEDVLSGIRVVPERLREQAERESRGKLLRMRALAIHRPADAELQQALASLESALVVIERALLRAASGERPSRGAALFEAIERHAGLRLRALPRLEAMREGREGWPAGADLDDLLAVVLHEVEALVQLVDGHAG